MLIDKIAKFSTSLQYDDLPEEVADKAKLLILDILGQAFNGKISKEAQGAIDVLCPKEHAKDAVTVYGTHEYARPEVSAYIVGTLVSMTVCNDTHTGSASHPGMCIIPALLALAESRGASGKKLLESIVVGYEVMCRLGNAIITPAVASIFRPTGILGPSGAGAACAHLIDLDDAATISAISLATNCYQGLNAWADGATSELNFHSGAAAQNGILSSLLAERGVIASRTVLEGPSGILAAFNAKSRAECLRAGLGEKYEILGIIYKPAPACIFTQGACQLANDLVHSNSVKSSDIESFEVRVTTAAEKYPGCNSCGPFEGKSSTALSIQFCVSCIIVAGGIYMANWDQDSISTEAINLARKGTVVVDKELDAAFPEKNGTKLSVLLKSGRTINVAQDDFRMMSREEIIDRFIQNASAFIGKEKATNVAESVLHLESTKDVAPVLQQLQMSRVNGKG